MTKIFDSCTAVKEMKMEIQKNQLFTLLGPVLSQLFIHLERQWKDHLHQFTHRSLSSNLRWHLCPGRFDYWNDVWHPGTNWHLQPIWLLLASFHSQTDVPCHRFIQGVLEWGDWGGTQTIDGNVPSGGLYKSWQYVHCFSLSLSRNFLRWHET